MRFVPIKSVDRQSAFVTHKLRNTFIKQRTACMNQIHTFLLEFGTNHYEGHPAIRKVPDLLEDAEVDLPCELRKSINHLYEHYQYLF